MLCGDILFYVYLVVCFDCLLIGCLFILVVLFCWFDDCLVLLKLLGV